MRMERLKKYEDGEIERDEDGVVSDLGEESLEQHAVPLGILRQFQQHLPRALCHLLKGVRVGVGMKGWFGLV